ncbi:ABC transporter permease [Microvirga puerhi]|uniref:ABC transporter permease n=1 Tax=Microvirga puerhi TaxID=2876078 RepID=A0ABS7VKJ9_9HYPH|nr:ABC transporter permease [Microvirga puerhi]MBZ6075759.1 ABC transporter permease [Microvirga puerhi]
MGHADTTIPISVTPVPVWRRMRAFYPIVSLFVLLGMWQATVMLFEPAPYLLPHPIAVANVIVSQFPALLYHTGITAFETSLAFTLSIAVAMPIAFLIARFRWFEETVYPLLVVSQAVPKVALAPLILVWLGFGLSTKVMIGILVAFFPVVISTVVGLKSVPKDMIFLGRSMGLSARDMFRKIYFPFALPSIFGGLKVCITLAVVGAVVGEFVGADKGLGYLILLASGQMQTALMFAALIFLVLIGVVSFALVQWAEARLMPWHSSVRQDAGH